MSDKVVYTDDYIQFRASKKLKESIRQAASNMGIGMSEYARGILARQVEKDLRETQGNSNNG